MNKKPVIVTGCGRSGTHWLGGVMRSVLGEGAAAHEPGPGDVITDCIVDSRLRGHARDLSNQGHRVVHLVRDGREVVRSLHSWHYAHGNKWTPFKACCEQWADAIDLMADFPVIKLRDLLARQDPSRHHTIPHWTEWDDDLTDTFWRICSAQMAKMGYE